HVYEILRRRRAFLFACEGWEWTSLWLRRVRRRRVHLVHWHCQGGLQREVCRWLRCSVAGGRQERRSTSDGRRRIRKVHMTHIQVRTSLLFLRVDGMYLYCWFVGDLR